MKVLLVYYTGTYNTRFLTDRVAERFEELGYAVDRVEITSTTPAVDAQGYDYVGFGYPIYGFNAPHPFLKYFKKLNFPRGQKYFIYKDSGETLAMNNASSRRILRRMKRKGAIFCGEYHFVMPYNIHFGFDENFIRQIVREDKKLLDIMFYNLAHGIAPKIKSKFIYNFAAFFVSIQAVGGNVNSFFYRVDGDKCTGCGLCAKKCPHANIKIKGGRVRFGHSCDMCMRCSFYCPEKAIKIGFLQGWQVNKYYDLTKLWNDDEIVPDYITENSTGFYKCFIKTFKDIDARYAELPAEQESKNF
ncbi:MAG: EFR1 family ferrodoxin [Candidatus Coproplasma sp.]